MRTDDSSTLSPDVPEPKNDGCTLGMVLLIVLCLWSFAGLVVYPLLCRASVNQKHTSDAVNQKQIAIALLQYIQDYDEQFPPVGYRIVVKTAPGVRQNISWGPGRFLPDGSSLPGILSPYTRSSALYINPDRAADPDAASSFHLDYLYNDLLAMQRYSAVAASQNTVLLTDSEDRFANFGHAYSATEGPFDGSIDPAGKSATGHGATIRAARTAEKGGAYFAFVDGHVKWFKGGSEDPIFFPPRTSDSPSAVDDKTKRQIGPDPGGEMTFRGRKYAGTFHIR